tara:strand:+ start:2818 stop:3387 length:570 start_codon:yes stop_codon:yes gene_type:complete
LIYTIETIPAKIFFKIQETGDTSLLSDESGLDTAKIWAEIEAHAGDDKNPINQKILELSKKIQRFSVRLEAITNAVFYLKNKPDEDLITMLLEYGYTLSIDNIEQDLERIARESQSLKIRIDKYTLDLDRIIPKQKGKATSYEDLYIWYLSIVEFGYESSNKVLYLDFKGLEKQVNAKIKSLDNNGGRR